MFAGEDGFDQGLRSIQRRNRGVACHRTRLPGRARYKDEASSRVALTEDGGEPFGSCFRDAMTEEAGIVGILVQKPLGFLFGASDIHVHAMDGEHGAAEQREFQIGAQAENPHKRKLETCSSD